MNRRRSACPINLTLETLGDRWSLIVLRDIMFGRNRTFRALLADSIEGIASNILADRLKRLVEHGLLSRSGDPRHKQRVVYSLTEKAIELVPLLTVMTSWALRHMFDSDEASMRARVLDDGGPQLWTDFMTELRHIHLGAPPPKGSVRAEMQQAYEAAEEQLRMPDASPALPEAQPAL
jgi:DNA-binding HxlR family transcriptional regulator